MPRQVRVLFTLVLAAVVAFGVIAYRITREQTARSALVHRTGEVLHAADQVLDTMQDAESGERGYLLTGDARLLEPYNRALRDVNGTLGHLERVTADTSTQHWIPELRAAMKSRTGELERTVALRQAGRIDEALAAMKNDDDARLMEQVREIIRHIREEQERLLDQRQEAWAAQANLVRTLLIGGTLLLAVVLLFSIDAVWQHLKLRQQVEDQRLRALELEQQLVGIVGHDLRSPLATVRLAAQVVERDGPLNAPQQQALERLDRSSRRMEQIVRDLLDFTQIRLGGGLRTTPARCDLHTLVADEVAEMRLTHPNRKINLEQEGDASGVWDPVRIEQLATNLINNALQHGQADRPVVVRTRGDGWSCILEVKNEGDPIPQQLVPRLFQPFVSRIEASADRSRRRSVGLGLFIVKCIVDAHQGTVRIESRPGAGTTVTVTLPKGETAEQPAERAAAAS